MPFKDPKAITQVATDTGVTKSRLSWDKALVAGFLAGAYIAFAGLLAIIVTAGLDKALWGGLITLFAGTVFTLGLILVVVAGSELLTGNMALIPLAAYRRKADLKDLARNWAVVLVGNVLGSLFVAYFLAVESGVVTTEVASARLEEIATLKGQTESTWEIFLRAVGCNWLVCLAVWMAMGAEDVGGKVLAIFFPIMGFVALGFDHVVANMFFLPASIFADAGTLTWGDTLHNWVFAFLGNAVGAAIFVSAGYWWLYGRDTSDKQKAGDQPKASGTSGEDGDGEPSRFEIGADGAAHAKPTIR